METSKLSKSIAETMQEMDKTNRREAQENRRKISLSQELVRNLIEDVTYGMSDTEEIMSELFRLSEILNSEI